MKKSDMVLTLMEDLSKMASFNQLTRKAVVNLELLCCIPGIFTLASLPKLFPTLIRLYPERNFQA